MRSLLSFFWGQNPLMVFAIEPPGPWVVRICLGGLTLHLLIWTMEMKTILWLYAFKHQCLLCLFYYRDCVFPSVRLMVAKFTLSAIRFGLRLQNNRCSGDMACLSGAFCLRCTNYRAVLHLYEKSALLWKVGIMSLQKELATQIRSHKWFPKMGSNGAFLRRPVRFCFI